MRSPCSVRAVLLLLSCSLLGQHGVHAFTWKPCDADQVPFIPDNVLLVPDPPAAGGQVTFNIQGNAGELAPGPPPVPQHARQCCGTWTWLGS